MAFTHLIDRLAEAQIEAPGPGHVELQRICIGRDTRMALFQHPNSRVRWTGSPAGTLHAAVGIKGNKRRKEILFQILADDRVIWKRSVAPGARWEEIRVDVPAGTLEFVTRAKDLEYAWSAWADPRIEHADVPTIPRPRRPRRRHVFLFTADALGSDQLRVAETPNLDRFSADAAVFEHGRSQSPTTIGSYASVLTGRHVLDHGVDCEWGRVPPSMLTLPAYLEGHGYHTTMIASESELSDPRQGFGSLFREALPCRANPAQDGAVTTRRILRWLDEIPDRPCFAWVQYFDAHPPNLPPEPYRSKYYRGDPAVGDARTIGWIRGLESVQHLMTFDGFPDYTLGVRLRDAGLCLAGRQAEGPDLATHLRDLGLAAEGPWLVRTGAALMNGEIPADLEPWIRRILPKLLEIEKDILSWLDGVRDDAYPVSQHLGCISYLDDQFGRVIAALKERDLYDDSVIVFLSPHGEVFANRGISFHHHVLFESVLRVPVIVKADGRTGRIGGIFDLLDLFPTLCEILGIPVPPALAGVSRWRGGPERPSLAVGAHGAMQSVYHDGFKLLHTVRTHAVSAEWRWRAGQEQLVDGEDRAIDRPEIAARLREHLRLG